MTRVDRQPFAALCTTTDHDEKYSLCRSKAANYYFTLARKEDFLALTTSEVPKGSAVYFIGTDKDYSCQDFVKGTGGFFGDYNELISTTFQNGYQFSHLAPYYEGTLTREVSRILTSAALYDSPEILPPRTDLSFSNRLGAYYLPPHAGDDVFFRVNLDPLNFASVETTDYLSTLYQDDAVKISQEYAELERLWFELDGPIMQHLGALIAISEFLLVGFGNEENYPGDVLDTQETLQELRDRCEKLSTQGKLSEAREKEILIAVGKLTWDSKPFLVEASRYLETKSRDLVAISSELIYRARLVKPRIGTQSSDGDLPEELKYSALLPFKTREQQDLYYTLVGKPSEYDTDFLVTPLESPNPERNEWGEAVATHPQAIEIPVSDPKHSGFLSPPEGALAVVSYYRNVLNTDFNLGLDVVETRYQGDPLNQVTSFYDRSKSRTQTEIRKDDATGDADRLLHSPDREYLLSAFDSQRQYLTEQKASEFLCESAVTHSEAWINFENDYQTLFDTDAASSLVNTYFSDENNAKSVLGVLGRLFTGIFQYSFRDITLNQFQIIIVENYEQFFKQTQIYLGSNAICEGVADEIWQKALGLPIAILERHQADIHAVSDECLPEFSGHYDGTLGFLISLRDRKDLPLFTRVSERVAQVDEVFAQAEVTLKIPKNYSETLRQWTEYQAALATFNPSGFESFQPDSVIRPFLAGDTDSFRFKQDMDEKLRAVEDLSQLRVYVDALLVQSEMFEENVLQHLWPWQAERFVNRLRFVIYYLDLRVREAEMQEKRHELSIDDFVFGDMAAWVELLPSGWPKPDGSSESFGAIDERYQPSGMYHLTQDQLTACILGTLQGDAEEENTDFDRLQKFLRFFTDYEDGYYRFFCLGYFVRDESGYDIKVIRDQDVLNRMLLVLADISEEASHRLSQTANLPEQQGLTRIRDFCDLARTSLAEFLTSQPYAKDWVTKDDDGEIVNIAPHRVYSTMGPQDFSSKEQEAMMKARSVASSYFRDPLTLYDPFFADQSIVDWYNGLKDQGSYALPPEEIVLAETVLRGLPMTKKDDYNAWLVENSWRAGSLYLLGRVAERLSHPLGTEVHHRYDFLRRAAGKIPVQDLERWLTCVYSGELVPSHWPISMSRLSLSPEEILWFSGYVETQMAASSRQQLGNGGDAVFMESKRQQEVDRFVFNMTEAEAQDLANQLFIKMGFHPSSLHNLDERHAAWLLTNVSDYYHRPDVLKEREERMALYARVEPTASDFPFTPSETLYALSSVAQDLYGTSFNLAKLEGELGALDSSFSAKKVRLFLSRLTAEEKDVFYETNRDNYQVYYERQSLSWLAALAPQGNDVQNFWRFVDGIIAQADEYMRDGQVDTRRLVADANCALQLYVEKDSDVLQAHTAFLIDSGLSKISAVLEGAKSNGVQGLDEEYQIITSLRKIVLERYNKADSQQVASHSQYNPNYYFYTDPEIARVKLSLDEIFSVYYFNNEVLRPAGAKPIYKMSEQRSVELVFSGIRYLLEDHPALVMFDGADGSILFNGQDVKVVIDGQVYLVTSNGDEFIPKDSDQKPIDKNLARKVLIEVYEKLSQNVQTPTCCLSNAELLAALNPFLNRELNKQREIEKENALAIYFTDSRATSLVLKYYRTLASHALFAKTNVPEAIPEFTRSELETRLVLVEQQVEMRRDDLAFSRLKKGA